LVAIGLAVAVAYVAVMEGQRRTRAILDTALDAIIGMDHQGRITEFNPAAERGWVCPDS
jgi:PAS domain-containing protein